MSVLPGEAEDSLLSSRGRQSPVPKTQDSAPTKGQPARNRTLSTRAHRLQSVWPRVLTGLHHLKPGRNTGQGRVPPHQSPLAPLDPTGRPARLAPSSQSLTSPPSNCPFSGTPYRCPSANCQLSCHSHKQNHLHLSPPIFLWPRAEVPEKP